MTDAGVKKFFWVIPIYLLGLLLLGNYFVWETLYPVVRPYHTVAYLFDYRELGFIKRGLIATLFPQNWNSVNDFAVFFALVVNCGVIAALTSLIQACRYPVVMLAVAASPFCVYSYGYDLGRLDHVAILYLLIWLNFWVRGYAATAWALYIAAPLLILVHEVVLFTILPFMFLVQNVERLQVRTNLIFGLNCASCAALVVLFGGPGDGYEAFDKAVAIQLGQEFPQKVLVSSLAYNVSLVMEMHIDPLNNHSIFNIFAFITVVILYSISFTARPLWIFGLACLGYTILFLLANDWARWISHFVALGGICLLSAATLRPEVATFVQRSIFFILPASVFATPASINFLFLEVAERVTSMF